MKYILSFRKDGPIVLYPNTHTIDCYTGGPMSLKILNEAEKFYGKDRPQYNVQFKGSLKFIRTIIYLSVNKIYRTQGIGGYKPNRNEFQIHNIAELPPYA